jgi:DNA-binding transcriptional ArsR family regulator
LKVQPVNVGKKTPWRFQLAIDKRGARISFARASVICSWRLARMGRLKKSGTTCRELLADLEDFGLDLYIAIWQYSYVEMNVHADRLSLAFGALADPTRRAILARLASGEADVSELMKPFALSQPTISKHLNVLERAGLVRRGRDAQRRPRTLVAVPLKDIADWMEPFRRFWEQKFAGLDDYLKGMQKKEKTRARKKR